MMNTKTLKNSFFGYYAAYIAAEIARIRTYSKSIDIIRDQVRSLLENIDEELKRDSEQLFSAEQGLSELEEQLQCGS